MVRTCKHVIPGLSAVIFISVFEDSTVLYTFREKDFNLRHSLVTLIEILVASVCFCGNKMNLLVGQGFVMTERTNSRVPCSLGSFYSPAVMRYFALHLLSQWSSFLLVLDVPGM